MDVIKKVQSLFTSKIKKRYPESECDNLIHHTAQLLKRSSSTCTCGGLSPPIDLKGYSYQCVRCNKQFNNICYNLGPREQSDSFNASPKDDNQLLDMRYYDEAISFLKQHYKSK